MNTSVPPHAPGDAPGTPPPPPQPDSLERFFAHLRGLGLHRSEDERWIGGVCGGLAERLRVDPLIVRAAFVLLGLVFGAGITIYLVAWVLLPDRHGAILLQRALRGGDGGAIALVIVAACVLVSGFGLFWGWGGPGPIVPLLLVGALLFYLHQRQKDSPTAAPAPNGWSAPEATGAPTAGTTSSPAPGTTAPDSSASSRAVVPFGGETSPAAADGSAELPIYTATSLGASAPPATDAPAPPGAVPPVAAPPGTVPPASGVPPWGPPPKPSRPRRRRLGAAATMMLLGLAAIVGSAAYLLTDATDLSEVATRIALGAAAVTVGLGIIGAGLAGRKAGFASFVGLSLAIVTALGAVLPREIDLDGPHGTRTWTPTSVSSSSSYSMGAGEGRLDLSRLAVPKEAATIRTRVSVGELHVVVPDGLDVRVKAHVDGGEISTEYPFEARAPERTIGGMDRSRTFTFGTEEPVLTVDADLGFGELVIERTPS